MNILHITDAFIKVFKTNTNSRLNWTKETKRHKAIKVSRKYTQKQKKVISSLVLQFLPRPKVTTTHDHNLLLYPTFSVSDLSTKKPKTHKICSKSESGKKKGNHSTLRAKRNRILITLRVIRSYIQLQIEVIRNLTEKTSKKVFPVLSEKTNLRCYFRTNSLP